MKNTGAVVALCLASGFAEAAIELHLAPLPQTGDGIEFAVVISGLEHDALAAFDFDVSFDPAHLAYAGAELGDPLLGDQLDALGLGGNSGRIALIADGRLNLFELSLDAPADLQLWQADNFTLATLRFFWLGSASSRIELIGNGFANVDGELLNVAMAAVPVANPAPLPAMGWSLAGGLALLLRRRRC